MIFVDSWAWIALFRKQRPDEAQRYINGVLAAIDNGFHQLIQISPDHFRRAWLLR